MIFSISVTLFLIIPKFFNYEKKLENIKDYLLKNYDLEINKHSNINFHILPKPKLIIENVEGNFGKISSNIFIDKLILYPKILSIYNYDNFQTNKLKLVDSKVKLDISEFKTLLNDILIQKKKFSFSNLELKFMNRNTFLTSINDVNFSNYGYNKNIFVGNIFKSEFKLQFLKDSKFVFLEFPNIGLKIDLKFADINKNFFQGSGKVKILDKKLKFNFSYINKKLEITKSYFRSKDLSFSSTNLFIFEPYFETKSHFLIEDFDTKFIEKINLDKLLKSKDIIKKINSKNKISFKSKKIGKMIINEFNADVDFEYGRINYKKILKVSENIFKCIGSINLFEEFPIIDFDCSIFVKNKTNFLKIFLIKQRDREQVLNLSVKGNIGIFYNKVNFLNIKMNDYIASYEDLKYFKDKFENILYDDDLLNIFNLKKIKKFILEIS